MENKKEFDIRERSFKFAVRVAKLTDKLPKRQSILEYSGQLIRSSASVGSNLEEADGAVSKKDFLNKLGISRKEVKESKFWLKLIKEVGLFTDSEIKNELDWLIGESEEIKLILSSIIINTKGKK